MLLMVVIQKGDGDHTVINIPINVVFKITSDPKGHNNTVQ